MFLNSRGKKSSTESLSDLAAGKSEKAYRFIHEGAVL